MYICNSPFWILSNVGNGISKVDSIILLITFACFIGYTIYMAKKEEEPLVEIQTDKNKRIIFDVAYIILGIIALKVGGDFVVENAEIMARHFNISEKIISLTIIAIGTSLPELVTSVTSAAKGNSDIAIGNILGSNIFNFLLIIGASGIIKPISYNPTYNMQMAILLISTIVLALFPYMDRKDQMTRSNGITYLMLYVLYMLLLFVK